MFARDGGGGDDDPYNFDIADGFGGNDAKRRSSRKAGGGKLGGPRSQQSRLGKSLLSKTVGSSPSSKSSVNPQSKQETTGMSKAATASDYAKVSLRASAPAGPTSALDKAMNFLNKYKREGKSTLPTSTATGLSSFRRSATANATLDDEDEIDISLSSDDAEPGRNHERNVEIRLNAPRNAPGPPGSGQDPDSRLLTDTRSSVRLVTAKELSIIESGQLAGPKAAVSPVGLPKKYTEIGSAESGRCQTNTHPQPGSRTSSLHLAVDIPLSPHSGVAGQERGSDGEGDSVESVDSMVAAAPEECILGGTSSELASSGDVNAEGSSSISSPARAPFLSLPQSGGTSDTAFARSREGSAVGMATSFENFTAVSGHYQGTTPTREKLAQNNSGDSNTNRAAEEAAEEDGEDDYYGDDDFEDVDGVTDSNGDLAPTFQILQNEGHEKRDNYCPETSSRSREIVQENITSAQAIDTKMLDSTKKESTPRSAVTNTIHGPVLSVSEIAHHQEDRELGEPRQAWGDAAHSNEQRATATIDSGTNPELRTGCNTRDNHEAVPDTMLGCESLTTGIKEAWGMSSSRLKVGTRSAQESVATATTVNRYSFGKLEHDSRRCIPRAKASDERAGGATGKGGLSKRGVLIDRSTEMQSPEQPHGEHVNIVVRPKTVASVEYAHDPERGLDLRSCGTQAVGSSAAVQVDILCPGMLGTNSALDSGLKTRVGRTPGVGYHKGEPYAKWGRFACDVPPGHFSASRDRARGGGAASRSSPTSSRCRPKSSMGVESRSGIVWDDGHVGAVDGIGSSVTAGKDPDEGRYYDCNILEGVSADSPSKSPAVSGAPAYLQMFLEAMAKSRAESCSAWHQVLEHTARPQEFVAPSDCRPPVEETREDCLGGDTDDVRREALIGDGVDTYGIMIATQDSFRRQLADMRENLNKIRYRAEVTGCQGYAHSYQTLEGARKYVTKIRPASTSHAEAIRIVDPPVASEDATIFAGCDTAPLTPGESHPGQTRSEVQNTQKK